MQPLPHSYLVAAAGGTSGDVLLTAADVPPLTSAAPSQFGGPGDQWSPESLLCAAIASCFILSFRAVARVSGLPWMHLECEVEGVLERSAGVTRFTRIVMRPVLTVAEPANTVTYEKLLSKAEHGCLIANSLNCSRELQTEIVQAPAEAVAAG
jgi:peroxiredoxin-like protein